MKTNVHPTNKEHDVDISPPRRTSRARFKPSDRECNISQEDGIQTRDGNSGVDKVLLTRDPNEITFDNIRPYLAIIMCLQSDILMLTLLTIEAIA